MSDVAIPTLPARDLGATGRFYELLGFEIVARYGEPGEYVIVRRGAIELHFFAWRDLDPWRSIAGCYLRVDDVASWHAAGVKAALPATGIPRVTAPEQTDYGMLEFAIVDADGNLLRIGQRVP